MKHKIADHVAEDLWSRDGNRMRFFAQQLAEHGAKRTKGQTAKQALNEALQELIKIVYMVGLQRGYSMGAAVFATDDDIAADESDEA